jgi:hypothetical protein
MVKRTKPTSDDDAVLAVVAKLVDALDRAFPASHDLELRRDALRLGRELLPERITVKRLDGRELNKKA